MSTEPTVPSPIATPGAAEPTTKPAAGPPRRRRLWQLPAQAHELLLALSFTPEALRREVARTLGRMRHGVCLLQGRDVDVLYSVVHDLVARNQMSEAFQKRLDERHSLAVGRMARLRDVHALQAAWTQALSGDDMSAVLWALLTHPLGAALESAALYDARAWVFAHGRRSLALDQAQAQSESREQAAKKEADELRTRLGAEQQRAAALLQASQAEIARLNGELARLRRTISNEPSPPPASRRVEFRERPTTPKTRSGPAAERAVPAALAPRPSRSASLSQSEAHAEPRSQPITVHGRRVLCVGGIQHAVAQYRGCIEKLGGHFEHHDGGLEDSVQALERRLGRADLVICQAACINHEAYHRVKRYCERTGTPCVYLDRPSLSRLERALGQPVGNLQCWDGGQRP